MLNFNAREDDVCTVKFHCSDTCVELCGRCPRVSGTTDDGGPVRRGALPDRTQWARTSAAGHPGRAGDSSTSGLSDPLHVQINQSSYIVNRGIFLESTTFDRTG